MVSFDSLLDQLVGCLAHDNVVDLIQFQVDSNL